MNITFIKICLLALFVCAPVTSAATEAADTIPSTPSNLTGSTYSSTALEIFWTRSSGVELIRHYEVYRDNSLVGLAEGNSWFEEGLQHGTQYRYSVVAVDIAGNQSNRSAIFEISTLGDTNNNEISPVTGLRADVYGKNFAEIFWDRPLDGVYTFRIFIEGQPVDETDGVSWLSREFPGGASTEVSVVAVNISGQESPPVSVTVTTPGDSDQPLVSPVTGLRVDVYSRTAAELFWDRQPGAGISYDVLARQQSSDVYTSVALTDGTSWFSNEFPEGTSTEMSVVAINENGIRSQPARITVTTPGEPPPEPEDLQFSDRPLSEIVPFVTSTLTGELLDDQAQAILFLHGVVIDTAASSEVLEFDPPEMNPPWGTRGLDTVYQCPMGGSLRADMDQTIFSLGAGFQSTRIDTYVFENCSLSVTAGLLPAGTYVVDGTFKETVLYSPSRVVDFEQTHQWSGFVINGPSARRTETKGQTNRKFSSGPSSGTSFLIEVSLDNYQEYQNEVLALSVTDNSSTLEESESGTGASYSYSISGVIKGTSTAGHEVSTNTDIAFSKALLFSDPTPDPMAGLLLMNSGNGDTLSIAAGNGNQAGATDAVVYSLQNSGGFQEITLPFTSLKIRPAQFDWVAEEI